MTRGSQEFPLLAEDANLLAFEGSPSHAHWLEPDQAEHLLLTAPTGNIAPEQIRDFLQVVIDRMPHLTSRLNTACDERADALLQAHQRVRQAARARGSIRVEAQRPPDVLGIYVLLPMPVRGA